jgi:hypothetical protein
VVDVASVQTFNQELTWEPKVFTDLKGLFVDVLGGEVFGDAAVVCVAEFDLVVLVVEEVVDVNIVYVTLDVLEVDVRLVVALSSLHS